MRSFHFSSSLVASLAVAGALAGGIFLTPPALQAQDQPKQAQGMLTISGTAIGPDSKPAAKLPVVVKMPTKGKIAAPKPGGGVGPDEPGILLQQKKGPRAKRESAKTLGKGVTDESGHFAVKFQDPVQPHQEDHGVTVIVEIGEKRSQPWAIKSHTLNKGKDMDLGNVQLQAAVR